MILHDCMFINIIFKKVLKFHARPSKENSFDHAVLCGWKLTFGVESDIQKSCLYFTGYMSIINDYGHFRVHNIS